MDSQEYGSMVRDLTSTSDEINWDERTKRMLQQMDKDVKASPALHWSAVGAEGYKTIVRKVGVETRGEAVAREKKEAWERVLAHTQAKRRRKAGAAALLVAVGAVAVAAATLSGGGDPSRGGAGRLKTGFQTPVKKRKSRKKKHKTRKLTKRKKTKRKTRKLKIKIYDSI